MSNTQFSLMNKNDIRVKEKTIQEIKLELEPCNKGNCLITRSGGKHKNFHSNDKLKIQYKILFVLLVITTVLTIASVMIYDSDNNLAIKISFFIPIPIGLVAIELSRLFYKKGEKHDEWFSFKEKGRNFYHNKDWKNAISNIKYALEIKEDSTALIIISACLFNLERFSQAIIYFEKLLEIEPQHVDGSNIIGCYQKLGMRDEMIFYINQFLDGDVDASILNNIGGTCLEEYDFEGALYFFGQAIEIEPTEPIFWTNKGMAYNDLLEFEQSIECFNRALQFDPGHKNAFAHKSVALHGLEKYDEIISLLYTFFEIEPLHKQTVNGSNQLSLIQHLTIAYAKTENFEKALKYCNQYLAVVPNDTLALLSKGDALISLSRFKEALSIYEEYLKFKPYDFKAINNKIQCLFETRNYVRAITCANMVRQLFPRFNAINYNLGVFFAKKSQHECARKFFKITSQGKSKDLIHMKYRAFSFRRRGLYWDEIETYQEMLLKKQNDVETMMALGFAFEKIQNYSEAIKIYDGILELTPQDNHALAQKGSSLTMMNRHSEAIHIYNKFLKNTPNDYIILANKGISLVGIHKYERSLKYFEKSLNVNPINFEALYGKGKALIGLNKYDEAIKALDESLEMNPNSYDSYLELGNACSFLGDRKKGIESFHRSLELKPQDPTTLYKLSQAYLKAYWHDGDIQNILNSIKYHNKFLGIEIIYRFQK